MKLPHRGMRSMGNALCVVDEIETRGTKYAILKSGDAVVSDHIRPVGEHATDYVSVAETMLHTPYLWAGTTAFGLDCSGFVKLAKLMSGSHILRDSDMQAATAGDEIDPGSQFEFIERGDLIFWRGHVGICQGLDDNGIQMIIHANGHSMDVTSEPLMDAIDRIAYLYEKPLGVRRG